ncbi:MAG: hypothetical protein D6706_17680 [Chloroflexi bacterium]|nr:MAG: hypothetical protein D6706_17680 [Chloroflexota bacterium]
MMSDVQVQCAARTKSGRQCRNYARPGSVFCHVHRNLTEPVAGTAETEPIDELVAELDSLVARLKETVPTDSMAYSPLRFVQLLRENVQHLTPEMQSGILESFQGMSKEDLMDIDTWKGMAYMLGYSARFQAGQMRERMNQTLPKPLQPDTWLGFVRQAVDRFAPGVAKDILQSFEGATKEDLLDPDTWKGVWYMLNYSLQFQAEQLKQRLKGEAEEEG